MSARHTQWTIWYRPKSYCLSLFTHNIPHILGLSEVNFKTYVIYTLGYQPLKKKSSNSLFVLLVFYLFFSKNLHLFIAQDIIKMSRFDIIGGYRLKLIFLFWGAPHSVCVTYFRCLSSGPLNGGMRLGYSTLILYPTGCQFYFCLPILLVLTQFNMPLFLSLSSNCSTKI